MASVFEYSDYRSILRAELARRSQSNRNYSQGAFARDLRIPPSRLCEILNGKQGISSMVGRRIAEKLYSESHEINYFIDLVECQHGRSRSARETAQARLRKALAQLFTEDGQRSQDQVFVIPADRLQQFHSLFESFKDAVKLLSQESDQLVACGITVKTRRLDAKNQKDDLIH